MDSSPTIDAHTEIQNLLAADDQLREWGVNTRLIGSYSRRTAIYPGKDGRATPQDRSVKIDFPDPEATDDSQAFAIDAVPAVRDADHWAVPTMDRKRWAESTGRWVTTDPARFGDLSTDLSTSFSTPTVGTTNAYKPVVKLMRQARRTHLGDHRPGGLYMEFACYDVWNSGLVSGSEWDALFASTLRKVADRFGTNPYWDLLDPGLGTAVSPALSAEQWTNAKDVLLHLADLADEALEATDCMAAVKWREILGQNDRGQVFPLPPGCDANGFPISAIASVAGTGSNEARKFG